MAQRIPQDFIDELLTRVDIVDVVDRRVPLKKTGRNYSARCPFHDEKSPSFTVSPDKQFYHCFGCGAHGSAIGFLMEFDRMEFVEAVEELADAAGMQLPAQANAPTRSTFHPDYYELLERSAHYYRRQLREHKQAGQAVDYLKKRGLTGEIAARFGIGYAPPGWGNLLRSFGNDAATKQHLTELGLLVANEQGRYYDRFRDRIMFPIRDARGRVIGFGGRVLGDEKPKYLNSPESPVFHKGRELYGLYEARTADKNLTRLLVVEGYMDVVALAQFGISFAVATQGTSATTAHMEKLFRASPEVIFCFDGDTAGHDAAWRALENVLPLAGEGRQVRFMFLPTGDDPDSLIRRDGSAAFISRIDKAIPLSRFFFEKLTSQVDISTMDGRARLVELARPQLSKLPSGPFRYMAMEQLADIARIAPESLDALLSQEKTAAPSRRPSRVTEKTSAGPQTPARRAIAMLLHHPQLAASAEVTAELAQSEVPGINLFATMVGLLQVRPDLTTGGLLEHWRDSDEGRHLAKLATWEPPVPEAGLEQEFRDTIRRLQEQDREQRTERLLAKARLGGLSTEEKKLLHQLLAEGKASPRRTGSPEG